MLSLNASVVSMVAMMAVVFGSEKPGFGEMVRCIEDDTILDVSS